jgi:hypothetical protein
MCLPGGLRLWCALLAAVPHIGAVAQLPAAQHMHYAEQAQVVFERLVTEQSGITAVRSQS